MNDKCFDMELRTSTPEQTKKFLEDRGAVPVNLENILIETPLIRIIDIQTSNFFLLKKFSKPIEFRGEYIFKVLNFGEYLIDNETQTILGSSETYIDEKYGMPMLVRLKDIYIPSENLMKELLSPEPEIGAGS